VCSTVTLQRYMFSQGLELCALRQHYNVTYLSRDWNCVHYGNIAKLHVCTGTGTVCSTVTLQRYIFYRDWICVQYGNIATLHVCTGTGTLCSTVTLQRYMFCTGTESVCSTVTLQLYMFVQGLELSAVH